MKKILLAGLLAAATYAPLKSQEVYLALDATIEYMESIKGDRGFHPIGLHQEHIERLMDLSYLVPTTGPSITTLPKLGENLNHPSITLFHKEFLEDDLVSKLPQETPSDNLEGTLFCVTKEQTNSITLMGFMGYDVHYGENVVIIDIANKDDPLQSILYKFVTNDNGQIESINYQQSYLPPTIWPAFTTTEDKDYDGMADDLENYFFGSTKHPAQGDYDGDGISNVEEITNGSNPAQYPRFARRNIDILWTKNSPATLNNGNAYITDIEAFLDKSTNLYRFALGIYKNQMSTSNKQID